jgi:hypothetical protein
MTPTRPHWLFALLVALTCAARAQAADLGVTVDKLVITDNTAGHRPSRLTYRSRNDAGIQKGAAGNPALLDGTLEVYYTDQPCNFAKLSLASGPHWVHNTAAKTRYRNTSGGGVKSAKLRPGKLAKLLATALGDDPSSSLDLVAGGEPSAAGGLTVILTIRNGNDASVHRMCTKFATSVGSTLQFKQIHRGTGRKLIARNGVPVDCTRITSVAMEPGASRGFFSMPWPNDIRKHDDGTLDLTGYPGSTNPLAKQILTAGSANTIAFGTNAALFFQTCGAVDPGTLPTPDQSVTGGSTALLVNLDNQSAPPIPLLVDFKSDAAKLRPARLLTLLPYPGHPLDDSSRYAAILFDGITAQGQPVTRAHLLADLDQPWDASKPVDSTRWAALQAQRDEVYDFVNLHTSWSASDVVAFTVFTTQDTHREMQAIADAIDALPAPTPVSRTSGDCSTSGADRTTINGTLDLPKWQAGTYPYTNGGGGIVIVDDKAVQQSTERVVFQMTVPCGPAPANGWPIFLFMDGTGASAHSNRIPYVGIFNISSPILPYVVATIAPLYSGDRYVPGLPPPYDQSELLFFNYLNPLAGRTNQMQQAADMIYLRRVVENLTFSASETATAAGVGTDDTIVVIGGHSQGALTVPHVLAVDAHFTGGFISSGGGGLYLTLVHRGDVRPLIDSLLGTGPGELDMFHPIAHAVQTLAEVGDAANYARRVGTAHVLSTGGLIDGCSPLEVVSVIGTAMGLDVVDPLVYPMFGSLSFEPGTTTLPAMGNLPGGRTGITVQLDAGHFGASTNPDLGRSFLTSLATGAVPTVNTAALLSDSVPGCVRVDPLP